MMPISGPNDVEVKGEGRIRDQGDPEKAAGRDRVDTVVSACV
jgi:hypothetical protein